MNEYQNWVLENWMTWGYERDLDHIAENKKDSEGKEGSDPDQVSKGKKGSDSDQVSKGKEGSDSDHIAENKKDSEGKKGSDHQDSEGNQRDSKGLEHIPKQRDSEGRAAPELIAEQIDLETPSPYKGHELSFENILEV